MAQLQTHIESLLFLDPKPFSLKKLAKICHASLVDVRAAVETLQQEYRDRNGGIVIVYAGDSVHMMTAPHVAPLVQEYLHDEINGELSRPSLETLTIIAYRGPVAKSEIELIRGVNCSLILRLLMMRGLIVEQGTTEIGSPVYTVTTDFLRLLGVQRTAELPSYNKLNTNVHLQEFIAAQAKDFFKSREA